jgi:hypothetical protein
MAPKEKLQKTWKAHNRNILLKINALCRKSTGWPNSKSEKFYGAPYFQYSIFHFVVYFLYGMIGPGQISA